MLLPAFLCLVPLDESCSEMINGIMVSERSSSLTSHVLYTLLFACMAQAQPVVTLSSSPTPLVLLETLSGDPVSALSGLNLNEPVARSLIAVRNKSDQAIVAISAAWRIIDQAGKERRFSQKV